jgi:hypothetical protein
MRTSRVQRLRRSPSLHDDSGRRRGSGRPHRCGGRCHGCQTASGATALQLMVWFRAVAQLACLCSCTGLVSLQCSPAVNLLHAVLAANRKPNEPKKPTGSHPERSFFQDAGHQRDQQSCAPGVCGPSWREKSARSRPCSAVVPPPLPASAAWPPAPAASGRRRRRWSRPRRGRP